MPIDWTKLNDLDSDKDEKDNQLKQEHIKIEPQQDDISSDQISVEDTQFKDPTDLWIDFAMSEVKGAGEKLDKVRQMSVGLGEFMIEATTGILGAFTGASMGGHAATAEAIDPNKDLLEDINLTLAQKGLEQLQAGEEFGPIGSPQNTFMAVFGATMDMFTYHPRTEYGKALSGAVGSIFQKFQDWADNTGPIILEETKGTPLEPIGPELATAVHTLIAGIPYIVPPLIGKGAVSWRNKQLQRGVEKKVARIKEIVNDISNDIPPEIAITTVDQVMKPSAAISDLSAEGKFFRSPDDMTILAKEIQAKDGKIPTVVLERDSQGVLRLAEDADIDLLLLAQELGDAEVHIKIKSKTEFGARPKDQQASIEKDANIINKVYEKADADLHQMELSQRKSYLNQLKLALVDVSAETKARLIEQGGSAGERAVMMHDLIAGATPKAQLTYQRWEDIIYKKLSREEMSTLDQVIQSRRIIEIDKFHGTGKIKHPGKVSGDQHSNALINMRERLGEDVFNSLWKRSDEYFKATNEALGELYTNGLIDIKLYKELNKLKYEPRKFIDKLDPRRIETLGGKKITVHDSGLRELKSGDIRTLESDSRLLLAEYISRIENRVARNKANKALLDFAQLLPKNGWVKEVKKVEHTKRGKAKKVHVPEGWNRIDVLIDGKQVPLIMDSTMAVQWITQSPQMTAQLANTARVLSGSIIVRPLATGYNPGFALVNFPRDIVHAWLATSEFSKHLPMYTLQMEKSLQATFKDAWHKDGAFIDYINEGGGMNFLTHQGTKLLKHELSGTKLGPRWRHIKETTSKLNEFSEIWVRLALRDQAIRNGKTHLEATWIARNYLDFSQGGWFTKSADNAIPYLNASTQAFRTAARQAKKDPKRFATQMLWLQGTVASLWLANYYSNPAGWADVPSDVRRNNFVIMTPHSFIDQQGNTRYMYFKIKKDNFMLPFTALPEMLLERYMEGRIPKKEYLKTLKDTLPIIPTEFVPPTYSAYQTYASNHDFWTDRDIWRGADVPPEEEFKMAPDRPTAPVFIDQAEYTGLSPARMEAASKKLFPNNPFTSLTGSAYNIMTEGITPYDKSKHTLQILADTPILRRIIGITHPAARDMEEAEPISLAGTGVKFELSRKLDNMYFESKEDILSESTIRTWINAQPAEERDRLHKRLQTQKIYDKIMQRYQDSQGVPSRIWWMNTGNIDAVTRADLFYQKWRDANGNGRRAMERLSSQLQAAGLGYATEHFGRRFMDLKKEFGQDYNTDTELDEKIIKSRKDRR